MASTFFTLFQAGDFQAALQVAEAYPPGHRRDRDIGTALLALRRASEAVSPLRRAVDADPTQPEIWRNLGMAEEHMDRPAAALEAFETAAGLSPQPRLTSAIARNLRQIGRVAEGEALLWTALAGDNTAVLRFQLAQILLAQGKWREAWPLYEARHEMDSYAVPASETKWDGKPHANQAVVLVAEQGAGDAIQFCRFARDIAAAGQPVILKVPKRLVALLSTVHENAVVIPHDSTINTPGRTQVWAPMMTVPGLFDLTPRTVPRIAPYLTPPRRSGQWAACLNQGALNVGLAWQGNPEGAIDTGRSIPLAAFAPLAAVEGVNLISLQVGHGTDQIAASGFADRLAVPHDLDTGPDAFLDTAALMQRLDLVVTSDTAIAHLAGALGRPTCLALRKYPEWRWLQDRDDSPWYPSMRLFRQRIRGNWDGVMTRIAAEVSRLAASRSA